jgi:hypothetical protein
MRDCCEFRIRVIPVDFGMSAACRLARSADCIPPFTGDEEAGYAGACHRAARCADPLGYDRPYALDLNQLNRHGDAAGLAVPAALFCARRNTG